ncbi:hypothetical protein CC80DRAFT_506262 [Byssothecium circinans]|uniref:Uncharacterized protein n=1 Tax=Byssothecium circinans TaxID=147558 RepID=A0A6A5TPJ1_9PLEO|nr:hypothetical protein CC80DRAFT_506262 [Byssothecium circinans]
MSLSRAVRFSRLPIAINPTTSSPRLSTSRNLSTSTAQSANKPPTPDNLNDPPPFNILAQIRASKRSVRYTVYAGFFLLATAETTFWANVAYAKYFAKGEKRGAADEFLGRVMEGVRGYRRVWLGNYWRFWGEGLWGL